MEASSLRFPVLQFSGGGVFPARTHDKLTTCTKVALKNGFFLGSRIIDSSGRLFSVRSATKLHGVGRFWGYNVFLNQTVRIALELELAQTCLALEEVKSMTTAAMRTHTWENDAVDIGQSVRRCSSVEEVARIIADAYFSEGSARL